MKSEFEDRIRSESTRALPRLCLVVPCYNEEAVLPISVPVLAEQLSSLAEETLIRADSFVLLVNDGSNDRSWEIMEALSEQTFGAARIHVAAIALSRNRGHQNALMAGLEVARNYSDITISIDADLQDDARVMRDMLLKYMDGAEIVYGVRHKRDTDSGFKRHSAQGYYRFMKFLGVELVYNHADYRLLSRTVLDALEQHEERNLFLRGLIPQLGFRHAEVYYDRQARQQGESKYNLKKMIRLAIEGITSFSVKPIRMIGLLGFLVFTISLIILVYIFARYFNGKTVAGWTTTVASVWALGGLQILSLAVIGEYIGKIYMETKHRPRYFIERIIGLKEREDL